MKEILIVGDSLTWGHDPATGLRHPPGQRWPVVLAEGLAGRALVTADGLGGRTTCFDDHAGPADRNAARSLPGLLASHQPLDLVVLMLGTNDLKPHVCGLATGAAAGMRRLLEIVRCFPFKGPRRPAVLVIAPPPCCAGPDGVPAGQRRIEESRQLAPLYRQLAEESGAFFLDAGAHCRASPLDGVHLDGEQTMALGRAVLPVAARILGLGGERADRLPAAGDPR